MSWVKDHTKCEKGRRVEGVQDRENKFIWVKDFTVQSALFYNNLLGLEPLSCKEKQVVFCFLCRPFPILHLSWNLNLETKSLAVNVNSP